MEKKLWVSQSNGKWKVHFEKEYAGFIYLTKYVALHEAKKMVKNSKEGVIASIWVKHEDGYIQREWTYGEDPFPPVG